VTITVERSLARPAPDRPDPPDWSDVGSTIWQDPVEFTAIRARLLALADQFRTHLVESRSLRSEWARLGIDVREVAMRGRGICSAGSSSRVVYVNKDDRHELRRFTVAHELAHLLLATSEQRRKPFAPFQEEELCEQFACALLIERAALQGKLDALGAPPGPRELLELCGQFRVNIRPILYAVGEELADTAYRLLLARWRGHRRRPEELAFRVEASAGSRHVFFPRDQRLLSLGLRDLADRAQRAPHAMLLAGLDTDVTIALRNLSGEQSSATKHGLVAWQAVRLGHDTPLLLTVLDLKDMLPAREAI